MNSDNSPLLPAVTLRLSVTLSLEGPGAVLGEGVSGDLYKICQEMVRIQSAYAGRVNMVVRQDIAFGTVLTSQPTRGSLVGEDVLI